jgi:hypothetical protein
MRVPRAMILMYHRVGEVSAPPDEGAYVLPIAIFEAQMRLLAQAWLVASLPALEGRYRHGSGVLTFDDGRDTDTAVPRPRSAPTVSPPHFSSTLPGSGPRAASPGHSFAPSTTGS